MQEDRATRMLRRVFGVIIDETQGWMSDLLRGMLDPSKIMSFIQSMGFDISQLPGLLSQQPSFDPYQIPRLG